MSRKATEIQDNGQVIEVVDNSTQEATTEVAPKTRTRKPRESAADKAISDIKELLNLKLQLQKEQEQVALIKPSIEKLLTSADITEEEAQNILKGLEQLGEYLSHKQQFQVGKDKAKAALALFEEAEITPDSAFELSPVASTGLN